MLDTVITVLGFSALVACGLFPLIDWLFPREDILDLRECDIIETKISPHADNVVRLDERRRAS